MNTLKTPHPVDIKSVKLRLNPTASWGHEILPDGSRAYFISGKEVAWEEYKKHILNIFADVRLFYFEIMDTSLSKKEGKVIHLNPHPVPYPEDILIHEIPDFLIKPKTLRDKVVKAGALELTEEEKIEYFFSESPVDFITAYFKSPHRGKYKVAGHLKDQQLKYTYPKDKTTQLSIFDNLLPHTKKLIEESTHTTREEIVEGIKLSPSEQKVIDSLCKLLHKGSQTNNPKDKEYYTGNLGAEITPYSGENTEAPRLGFTLYELTKEYKGGEYVGGKDIENVKKVLRELNNKQFLLSYIETIFKKDGGRIERKIEDFKKLIHILKLTETEYSNHNIELSKKEESIILLNPIFRRQIDSKFILYPEDINKRTIIAYGSHNVSEITFRLRDYLIRELSSKRYKPEFMLDKLYYFLAEKWMGEGRKKLVKGYVDKAMETCKALGLLKKHEITQGATGEQKVIFYLNKRWG